MLTLVNRNRATLDRVCKQLEKSSHVARDLQFHDEQEELTNKATILWWLLEDRATNVQDSYIQKSTTLARDFTESNN
jgi:hypothetical protein